MNQATANPARFNPVVTLWFGPIAFGGVAAAYLIAVKLSMALDLRDAVLSTLANVVPLALLGLAVRQIVRRELMAKPTHMQLAAHALLGPVFALSWYWALMVLLGLQAGHSWTSFEVRPIFSYPAIAWMLLQGLTFYALIVSLTHLQAQRPAEARANDAPPQTDMVRYFIRDADAIRPVAAREIVVIRGAGDYAEVTTCGGHHLARRTLAEFEALLNADSFIRVHRAAIVNLDRVVRAEPAGDGRLLIHMENGEMIQTSRAGAKLLRSHVI